MLEEDLLFAATADLASALEAVPPELHVVQRGSRRLALLRGTRSALDAFIKEARLSPVIEVSPELLEQLVPGERLFIEAWAQNLRQPTRQRRGDGLAWDAPGFEPPDPPGATCAR